MPVVRILTQAVQHHPRPLLPTLHLPQAQTLPPMPLQRVQAPRQLIQLIQLHHPRVV